MKMTIREWFSEFKDWIPGLGRVSFLSKKKKFILLTPEQKKKFQQFEKDIHRDDPRATCCCPCHFEYEEKHVFPYLPKRIREELQKEHDRLLKQGLPPKKVFAHAKKETVYFRKYLPKDKQAVMERIDTDHFKFWKEHTDVNPTVVRN